MNTTVTPANTVTSYAERLLLMQAMPMLLHPQFGRIGRIEPGNGKTIKFVRINSLPAATTPLDEGVDPNADVWGKTEVTADLAEYGGLVKNSDLKLLTESDFVLNGVVEEQGNQAGLTLDTVCRDVVNGGSSVVRGGNVAARTDIVTAVAKGDIDRGIMQLASGNARRFTGYEFTSAESNTTPIAPAYIAIVHEHLRNDIKTACGADWVPAEKYPSGAQRFEGELGYYNGVRFVATTNAKVWANGGGDVAGTGLRSTAGNKVDVYSILMLGREAFGIAQLNAGANVQVILKTPDQAGSLANRYGSSAWVAKVAYKILNDAFLCRVEAGATA